MLQNKRLLLFTLLLTIRLIAQGNLSGSVMTLDNNPIPNAMVQLMKGDNIISYTATKVDGGFSLKYNELGNYTIEVNAFNFEKLMTDVSILTNKSKPIELKLFPETKKLDEVTVIGKSSAMKEDGDKISYNLGAFTNGSEKNLKDIINKLPGMEVDANGKIKANGKVVDKLLIDGEEFFGDNHQLATENISSDMIDGIDLLNHFENNSNIKDIESSDKKALNIAIKKSYKGKIKGNLSALSGYENRYSGKANLFRFDKKSNLSFIGNLNNINEQAITVEQYYNMNNSIKNEIKNNEITNASLNDGIPSNLLSNEYVIEKKSKFGALNFSVFPSSNFKINGFTIINETIQKELTQNNNTFIENPNFNSNENINTKGNLLFNQTKINVDYKLNSSSYLSYSILFDPRVDHTNKSIVQNQTSLTKNINEENENRKINFGQQISYINRLSKNKLVTLNIFNEIKNNTIDYLLDTNKNLFTINTSSYLQDQKYKTLENGILSKLAIKKNNIVYIFGLGYNEFNQNYNSNLNYSNTTVSNELNSLRTNFSSDFGFYKKNGRFQFNLINKLKYFNSFEKNSLFYLPQIQFKYEFKPTHYISTTYNRNVKFANENQLFSNQVIQNYTSFIENSQLVRNNPIKNNSFGINYLYIHLFSGTILFATVNYDSNNNTIGQNFTQEQDFSKSNFRTISEQNNLTTNVVFERKIKFIKSRIKTEFTFANSKGINYLSNIENSFVSKIYSSKISLISNFKKKLINYTVGFENQSVIINYEKLNLKNKSEKKLLFINFDGTINKNLKYHIGNSYHLFQASNINVYFNKTDFEFTYDNENRNWKYFLKGNDIFNIKSNQIIENNLESNLEQTRIRSRIPGFIGLGIKYIL